MTEEERKELGEKFVKVLNELGVKNIQDIPPSSVQPSFNREKEHKDVWVIKG